MWVENFEDPSKHVNIMIFAFPSNFAESFDTEKAA